MKYARSPFADALLHLVWPFRRRGIRRPVRIAWQRCVVFVVGLVFLCVWLVPALLMWVWEKLRRDRSGLPGCVRYGCPCIARVEFSKGFADLRPLNIGQRKPSRRRRPSLR